MAATSSNASVASGCERHEQQTGGENPNRGPDGGNPTPKRDKGFDLEYQVLASGTALVGPRGAVWWKSVGAFLFRAKAKRRKAVRVGKLAPSSESPIFVGTRKVVASGLERSLLDLTRGGLKGSATAVGGRTKEQTTDGPADQGPARSIRKAVERLPQPRGRLRRGGKAPAAKVEEAISKASWSRTASPERGSRRTQTGTYFGLPRTATSSLYECPTDQSPHRALVAFTSTAMCQRRNAMEHVVRTDGADGSQADRRWG